ncbi:MAG: phosphatidate cytidylyltransferase, partial [Syntrophomonas sp.]
MLRTRIITAAIGIPILLGIAYLGGNYWAGLIALLMAVVLLEYFAMMRCRGFQPIILPAYLMAFILLFRVQLDQNMTGLFWAGLLLMILS